MRLLAIETSCDETSVAVVSTRQGVEHSLVSSQVELHRPFGGVVPEVACRAHQEWLPLLTQQALKETGYTQVDFDGLAVTYGPGLIGALLVGLSFTRSLAWGWGKPWVGINHLEGHLASLDLLDPPFLPPYVALLASGGHTEFFYVNQEWIIRHLGGTLDDAAGEAFDKVSHLLGLGYPGGPAIEKAALHYTGKVFPFAVPMRSHPGCDLSFSGLKTAVARALSEDNSTSNQDGIVPPPSNTAFWAASFQQCALEALVGKVEVACESMGQVRIAIVGGVAANQVLRTKVTQLAQRKGWELGICPFKYCGDNAAMIGAAAFRVVAHRGWSPLDLEVAPRLSLGVSAQD
jgi:N6-L-threonylcarbamoyladenine synthase